LDLPGNAITTRRFKTLFLCDSVVIRVSMIEKREDGTVSGPSIQFLDLFMEPNREYINVTVSAKYEEPPDTERYGEDKENYNFHQYTRLVEKLEKIVEENPRKYNEMKKKGTAVIKSITNELIYKYIRRLMFAYRSIGEPGVVTQRTT
jgi:hypothetical protein